MYIKPRYPETLIRERSHCVIWLIVHWVCSWIPYDDGMHCYTMRSLTLHSGAAAALLRLIFSPVFKWLNLILTLLFQMICSLEESGRWEQLLVE